MVTICRCAPHHQYWSVMLDRNLISRCPRHRARSPVPAPPCLARRRLLAPHAQGTSTAIIDSIYGAFCWRLPWPGHSSHRLLRRGTRRLPYVRCARVLRKPSESDKSCSLAQTSRVHAARPGVLLCLRSNSRVTVSSCAAKRTSTSNGNEALQMSCIVMVFSCDGCCGR